MKMVRRTLILFTAFLLAYTAWPAGHSHAKVNITRFYLGDLMFRGVGSELIAGQEYIPYFESDKHFLTTMEYLKYEYSGDNGATWINLPVYPYESQWGRIYFFRVPIDPQLSSVKFRVSAYFSPLVGARSYAEKEIGPYKVLQPGEPTDFSAAPNSDGTVTLKWNDNSNMESYYQIERSGPDGTKTFRVDNTKDRTGPLSYADKETDKSKSTIYVYKLSAVIDGYELPENLLPGTPYVVTKTTAPINPFERYKDNLDISLLDIDDSFTYLKEYDLKLADLFKVQVNGVKLNKSAVDLGIGQSETLTAAVQPAGAADKRVTWSSDNRLVAEVDAGGKITAKSPGSAIVTVTTASGAFAAEALVTVRPRIDKPYLDPGMIVFDPEDDGAELEAIELQQLLTQRQQAMQRLAELLKETEESAGTVIDNMGGAGGDPIAVGFVYIDKEEMMLPAGQSEALTAMVAPPDATNQRVAWSSDNSAVASVDSTGRVTAKSPGIAHITVRTEDGGFTNVCRVTVVQKQVEFRDIGNNWAGEEIEAAVGGGIVTGYPDGTFRPDARVTRAEFTTMLMKGLKPAESGSPLTFADKDKIGAWALPSMEQAVELGIIGGYADNTVRPNAYITRAEMIAMVIRASGLEPSGSPQTGFADDRAIPAWAKPSVATAQETGIIIVGGLPGGQFAPQTLSTRADAASAIVRMLEIRR